MINLLKNISLYIVISIIVNISCIILKSKYIIIFLDTNLILIIIALMAINTTTISIIMTKLRELADKYGGDFTRTSVELKWSICEQVWLIIIGILLFILKHSEVVRNILPHHDFIFQVLIVAIFCFSIHILYDTANSVFIILKFEEKNNRSV